MKIRKWFSISVGIAMTLGMFTVSSAHAAQSSCRSATDPMASFYLQDCTLPYSDSGAIIDKIDTCNHYDSLLNANLTNPGRDWIVSTRILRVTPKGEVVTPSNLNFLVTMNLDCRRWKSYKLDGQLVSPTGVTFPISFGEGEYSDQGASFDVSDYCFLVNSYCGWLNFSGTSSLPSDAPAGSYSIKLHATTQGVLVGDVLPLAEKTMIYSNILQVTGVLTATPGAVFTPLPTITPSVPSLPLDIPLTDVSFIDIGGNLGCLVNDFTKSAVQTYGITGTHWRISTTTGDNSILDEYDLGLGVQPNGDPIRSFTPNGYKVSRLSPDGNVSYSYFLRNQKVGFWYECSVAVRTDHGIGRYISEDLISKQNVANFNVVKVSKSIPLRVEKKETINCIKGKTTQRVIGLKPSCPEGYKKK